jgi:hypothetical protein
MTVLPVLFQLTDDTFRVMVAGVGGIRGAIGQLRDLLLLITGAIKQFLYLSLL